MVGIMLWGLFVDFKAKYSTILVFLMRQCNKIWIWILGIFKITALIHIFLHTLFRVPWNGQLPPLLRLTYWNNALHRIFTKFNERMLNGTFSRFHYFVQFSNFRIFSTICLSRLIFFVFQVIWHWENSHYNFKNNSLR